MLDIKFLRENPELVKENIRKKFEDQKVPMVDEVILLDEQKRAANAEACELRANRNKVSKEIGVLMAQGKKEEAMEMKELVTKEAQRLAELEAQENELEAKVKSLMMKIPNIIDPSVPIGKDDIPILWRNLTALTKKPPERLPARASIILWVILPVCTAQCLPMPAIL